MTPEQILQNKLHAMRPRFLALLAERSDRLEALSEEIDAGAGAIEPFLEFRSDSHKIAGAAAYFGFNELGLLASQSEQAITAYLAESRQASLFAAVTASIDDLLGEMTAIIVGAANE